jgi:hypothetical protein
MGGISQWNSVLLWVPPFSLNRTRKYTPNTLKWIRISSFSKQSWCLLLLKHGCWMSSNESLLHFTWRMESLNRLSSINSHLRLSKRNYSANIMSSLDDRKCSTASSARLIATWITVEGHAQIAASRSFRQGCTKVNLENKRQYRTQEHQNDCTTGAASGTWRCFKHFMRKGKIRWYAWEILKTKEKRVDPSGTHVPNACLTRFKHWDYRPE